MKPDRELLHLAAKAAGITLSEQGDYRPNTLVDVTDPGRPRYWNPLTDDGDALRLLVQLRLCVGPNMDGSSVVVFGDHVQNIVESYWGAHAAATRRAIVRAAAAMGEQT